MNTIVVKHISICKFVWKITITNCTTMAVIACTILVVVVVVPGYSINNSNYYHLSFAARSLALGVLPSLPRLAFSLARRNKEKAIICCFALSININHGTYSGAAAKDRRELATRLVRHLAHF